MTLDLKAMLNIRPRESPIFPPPGVFSGAYGYGLGTSLTNQAQYLSLKSLG